MNHPKIGRKKIELMCSICKKKCLPKEGDWFWAVNSESQQCFMCVPCERSQKSRPKPVNRRKSY